VNGIPSAGFDAVNNNSNNNNEDLLALTSTAQSHGLYLSAICDCLVPSVCGLIVHPDGDVRVVVASVLRRMMPNSLRGDFNDLYTVIEMLHQHEVII